MSSHEPAVLPTNLTRNQLHALVWEKPISHLAKAFGISHYDLVAICTRLDIPRPARGHWNKLAAGKAVETRALPPKGPDMADRIKIAPLPRGRAAEPAAEEALAAARGSAKMRPVAERLVRPHPIIAGWLARREREIRKGDQIYDRRLKRSVRPSAFSVQERRRHRILDALFKALEAENISVTESERLELFATSGREKIEFQLRVKLQQVRRPLTADEREWYSYRDKDYRLELAETEALIFEVKTWLPANLQRNWQDGRKGTVETMAGDILATMLAAFPLMVAEREQREKAEERRRIEEQRRHELEQQRKLDQNRFRCLLEQAGRWREAELARSFVAALRAAIADPTVEIDDRPASEWLDWAEARASQHDPLASDPLDVFDTIADVTNWTYRDR
ncbi:hypothetical protein PX699_02660 [Sphingobium sp. H39-3-25]|uniref:hypothetical protein n=1 Tax=Sphingobium arseniciresistens TaxID=3030834 RepID=UPI0023B89964|nr:hypothetical protein [Sphingobium arseniciresistens]